MSENGGSHAEESSRGVKTAEIRPTCSLPGSHALACGGLSSVLLSMSMSMCYLACSRSCVALLSRECGPTQWLSRLQPAAIDIYAFVAFDPAPDRPQNGSLSPSVSCRPCC